MSYENAPATRLLATHCAICNRPLVDARSVETGIGPDCRKKVGYDDEVTEAVRERANELTHKVALNRYDTDLVLATCTEMRLLGLVRLPARIEAGVATLHIEEIDGVLLVKTPYNERAVVDARNVPGRRWDAERKVNTFPSEQRKAVWHLLRTCYPGAVGIGPKGAFTTPKE